MKKGIILELIRSHCEGNDQNFKNIAYEIAQEFDSHGDTELAHFIMAQLSSSNTFIPQQNSEQIEFQLSDFFYKLSIPTDPFPLPKQIEEDILAIIHAIVNFSDIHKFLFHGSPGTGKTESVKHIARILKRDLYSVDFSKIIDSKLGQTAKNIHQVFKEMNQAANTFNPIFLFDEIDILALDRTNQQDLREMGRATSTVLRQLDELNDNVILFATTNLLSHFDKALTRRFDALIDFNRYSHDDIIEVSDKLLEFFLKKFQRTERSPTFFHKILNTKDQLPYPGDLKNIIKRSVVFSSKEKQLDYLRRLYIEINGKIPDSLEELKKQGFSLREMEIITTRSKSQICRILNGTRNEK